MRLLVINPNTNAETTARILKTSQRVLSNGNSIKAVTAAFGAKTIKTLKQSTNAAEAVLDALHANAELVDAAIIAAYSDPGLLRAKSVFKFPVVGIGEASMIEAAAHEGRFSIITMGDQMVDYIKDRANEYGVGDHLASVRILPWEVTAGRVKDVEKLTSECMNALRDDDADTVIIGGGPLAGFAQQISRAINAPILDGIECAVRRAELLGNEQIANQHSLKNSAPSTRGQQNGR